MKIIKISSNKDLEPTDEMISVYEERTNRHIDLVRKYCDKIIEYDEDRFGELEGRKKVHDDSKFEEPEYTPYIYITWKYRCQDNGGDFEECNPPENLSEIMDEATIHHVTTNSHHPEYHDKEADPNLIINKENRDQPPTIKINATSMPDIDIAEMVADWCSVSEERGNTPKSWADKNVGVRWEFSEDQKELIYELIDAIWE